MKPIYLPTLLNKVLKLPPSVAALGPPIGHQQGTTYPTRMCTHNVVVQRRSAVQTSEAARQTHAHFKQPKRVNHRRCPMEMTPSLQHWCTRATDTAKPLWPKRALMTETGSGVQDAPDSAEPTLQEPLCVSGPEVIESAPQKELGTIECCSVAVQSRGCSIKACRPSRRAATPTSRVLADEACKASLQP